MYKPCEIGICNIDLCDDERCKRDLETEAVEENLDKFHGVKTGDVIYERRNGFFVPLVVTAKNKQYFRAGDGEFTVRTGAKRGTYGGSFAYMEGEEVYVNGVQRVVKDQSKEYHALVGARKKAASCANMVKYIHQAGEATLLTMGEEPLELIHDSLRQAWEIIRNHKER